MIRPPLISAAELQQALAPSQTPPLVLDCSFDLADAAAGERSYREGHIPGALYVNLKVAGLWTIRLDPPDIMMTPALLVAIGIALARRRYA